MKQNLTSLDVPNTVPANLFNVDLTLAIDKFQPGKHTIQDLEPVLNYFDKHLRARGIRPKPRGKRVMSMPVFKERDCPITIDSQLRKLFIPSTTTTPINKVASPKALLNSAEKELPRLPVRINTEPILHTIPQNMIPPPSSVNPLPTSTTTKSKSVKYRLVTETIMEDDEDDWSQLLLTTSESMVLALTLPWTTSPTLPQPQLPPAKHTIIDEDTLDYESLFSGSTALSGTSLESDAGSIQLSQQDTSSRYSSAYSDLDSEVDSDFSSDLDSEIDVASTNSDCSSIGNGKLLLFVETYIEESPPVEDIRTHSQTKNSNLPSLSSHAHTSSYDSSFVDSLFSESDLSVNISTSDVSVPSTEWKNEQRVLQPPVVIKMKETYETTSTDSLTSIEMPLPSPVNNKSRAVLQPIYSSNRVNLQPNYSPLPISQMALPEHAQILGQLVRRSEADSISMSSTALLKLPKIRKVLSSNPNIAKVEDENLAEPTSKGGNPDNASSRFSSSTSTMSLKEITKTLKSQIRQRPFSFCLDSGKHYDDTRYFTPPAIADKSSFADPQKKKATRCVSEFVGNTYHYDSYFNLSKTTVQQPSPKLPPKTLTPSSPTHYKSLRPPENAYMSYTKIKKEGKSLQTDPSGRENRFGNRSNYRHVSLPAM